MNQYRYQLAHKVKKELCPMRCEGQKNIATWRRYIDTTSGELLPPEYGVCDNANKCRHRYTPQEGGLYKREEPSHLTHFRRPGHSQAITPGRTSATTPTAAAPLRIDLPELLVNQHAHQWRQSAFARNLTEGGKCGIWTPPETLTAVANLYGLGAITQGPNAGAVVFLFRNHKKQPRYAQVKGFDEQNHGTFIGALHLDPTITKLAKNADNDPWAAVVAEWLPSYTEQETKQDCLFGAHLLDEYPEATCCLVEAPKTAIYASLILGTPNKTNMLYLATGGAGMLTAERCEPLKGRNVVLFPDIDQHDAWEKRGNEIARKLNWKLKTSTLVLDHQEQIGPKGDLADLLEYYRATPLNGEEWSLIFDLYTPPSEPQEI